MKIVKLLFILIILFAFVVPYFSYVIDDHCTQNGISSFCYNYKKISNGCLPNLYEAINVPSQARYELINGEKCAKLKRYKSGIIEAVEKYKTPKLQLTTGIIGAMLNQESNVGLSLTNGSCTGYGDNGHGHGLAQIDNRFFKELPSIRSPTGIRVSVTTKTHGLEKFVWSDCGDAINWLAAYLVQTSELTEKLITKKAKAAELDTSLNSNGSFKDPIMQKVFLQLTLNSYNSGPGLFSSINNANCEVKKGGEVTDDCTTDKAYGSGVLKTALEVNKCLEIKITNQEKFNSVIESNGTDRKRECIRPSKEPLVARAQNGFKGTFPLRVTNPNVILRYTNAYNPNGHNGIDIGPSPQTTQGIEVISADDGTVTMDRKVDSLSCVTEGNCKTKSQRAIRIKSDQANITYVYVHLSDGKPFPIGTRIKRGQVIGGLDNFMFIHLHFRVDLNDITQEPLDYIQNWDRNKCRNPATCLSIPKEMYR